MADVRSCDFDVIVIGGGHAGCEAFAAATRVGARAALVTPDLGSVAVQPCNPAVGGPGKGHLVREVVALGGLIGKVTDASGLQFRTLNRRKGPAVRATRVQTDSRIYATRMGEALAAIARGALIEDEVVDLVVDRAAGSRRVTGVRLQRGGELRARAVVITTGTFLRGMLFVGAEARPGGRRDAAPSVALAAALEELGLPLLRLKTGTCPRLDGGTVETDRLEEQRGDDPPPFFDPSTTGYALPQRSCHLTYTGEAAHQVVRENLARSALFSGAITGIGPRYCPSIETKVARFPERERHQVFLEPEDVDGRVVYPSGLSTSLPIDAQERLVRAIPGLERARIVRWGYAVEYDAVQPRCLSPSLEIDGLDGLFLAGQILGTSGYEEAAATGLLAGANAALEVRGDAPFTPTRDQAYLGVMVDDLTARGVDEPYRMFTSRAEFRLLLREDNAEDRLVDDGVRAGLIDGRRAAEVRRLAAAVDAAADRLRRHRLTPSAGTNDRLAHLGLGAIKKPLGLVELLRRAGIYAVDLVPLAPWLGELPATVRTRLDVDVKYAGYLTRQREQAERLAGADRIPLPGDLDYDAIPGLRGEIAEKLNAARPATLGQAGRIPGVTPAALEVLHVWSRRGSS